MISGISISLWGSFSITPLASKHIPGESIVAVVKVRVVIPIQTSISISLSKGNKRQQNQKLHSDHTLETESH